MEIEDFEEEHKQIMKEDKEIQKEMERLLG